MKPWVKLWREERRRFRALPLAARCVAAYVLKFCDRDGGLPLGDRDPVTAVALAIGASVGERRWLRPAVDALLAHGYLVVREDALFVANFPRYQVEGDASRARVEREIDARPTPTRRESSASRTRNRRETDPNATRVERESDMRIDSTTGNDSVARDMLLKDIEGDREGDLESASHSPCAGEEASPADSVSNDPPRPKPAWLAALEPADRLTLACLVAFDAGYATTSPGKRPLGVRSHHADLGTRVADAQGIGVPEAVFREAGAELGRRVSAAAGTDYAIKNPWRIFCGAPIGTFLGTQAEQVQASQGTVALAEQAVRAAREAYESGFGQDGTTERKLALDKAQRELFRAREARPS